MGFMSSMALPRAENNRYLKKIQIDLADKLNWEVTVNLLVIAVLVVTNIKHFINKLISCTVPIHFSDNQEQYANEVCFIADKYFVLDTERILIFKNDTTKLQVNFVDDTSQLAPVTGKQQQLPIISYYIFVPYILMMEALLIIVPRKLWSYFLQRLTSFDVDEVIEVAHTCKNFSNKKFKEIYLNNSNWTENISSENIKLTDEEDAREIDHFNFLINQIQRWTFLNLSYEVDRKRRMRRKYLCFSYLLIKLLSIVNIFMLIFIINNLLSIDLYHILVHILHDFKDSFMSIKPRNDTLLDNENHQFQSFYLMNSYYFPLRSMCAFKIRELSKTNVYAVMCTLPINLFNQYIFILILIWFTVLLAFNIYYLIFWIIHFQRFDEISYTKEKLYNGLKTVVSKRIANKCDYLYHMYKNENENVCQECENNFNVFYQNFLSSDLIFFLKIVAINSSDNLIQQIFVYMWKIYEREFKSQRRTLRRHGISQKKKLPKNDISRC